MFNLRVDLSFTGCCAEVVGISGLPGKVNTFNSLEPGPLGLARIKIVWWASAKKKKKKKAAARSDSHVIMFQISMTNYMERWS